MNRPSLVSKPLKTPMDSSGRVDGRIGQKNECVRLSMCICYVDVYERECVVSECERVNEVDLYVYFTYSSLI